MRGWQSWWRGQLPLALPVILVRVRIVEVLLPLLSGNVPVDP